MATAAEPSRSPSTPALTRRALLGGVGGFALFAVLPGGRAFADPPPPTPATVKLSTSWKFATDPSKVGVTDGWYATGFDDSAWQALVSGKSWETQGVAYSGFGWYRQQFTVPATAAGAPLTLVLASFTADDVVWFNGTRVGGLSGQYQYNDRKLRTYTVPVSAVNYGATNTIAVRCWGGQIEGTPNTSGLIAGTYSAQLTPYRLMARPTGGDIASETPLELWDLSSAQQGAPFELVFRYDPAVLTGSNLSYSLQSYATPFKTGSLPITTGADGIARAVLSVDAATARQIYLTGRPRVDTEISTTVGASDWTATGTEVTNWQAQFNFTGHYTLYKRRFPAGTVRLGAPAGFVYSIAVVGVSGTAVLGSLTVADAANAADWSVRANLQVGDQFYGDRDYPFASVPADLLGAPWVRSAADSKGFTGDPLVSFTIDRDADVYVGVETRAPHPPWIASTFVENLCFAARDALVLPELAGTFEDTPYGSLKLVDVIDCATDLDSEPHPYLQSGFEPLQQYKTPGSAVTVSVGTILGRGARESGYGWFAYRIGRGTLTPGASYLVRIEYPEDKPRYCPVELQVGQNYVDVGWRTGVSPDDQYDPWPLSGGWQFYDVIVPLGALTDGRSETTGSGGAGDGDARHGFWIYFMNKIKPGYQFSPWQGGPAVATIRLYEISPTDHAPAITRPAGLPTRMLSFDWERQPTPVPQHVVDYAKLMGYSAVSPLTLKWAYQNYADPVAGYDAINVDDGHYWVTGRYAVGSGTPPPAPVPGRDSVHRQYLQATAASGVDYLPRFEYGGSYDLPADAKATGPDGNPAVPNRFSKASDVANLLDPRTFTDLKAFLDSLLLPYTATNPQLKGALWRMREDRMQASYGPADVARFTTDTGVTPPAGLTDPQLAAWASTGTVGQAYATWWHTRRAAFHQQVLDLIRGYRADLTLAYYNWDPDKFSLLRPDIMQAAFYTVLNARGGPAAYAEDRAARATYTAAEYINAVHDGDAAGWIGTSRPAWGVRPALYSDAVGMQVFAPASWLTYADKPEYLNYFRTADGLAVSNAVNYDEAGARYPNPKFEGHMVLPGGGPFSMATELLAWYHGDARTLSYTVYTHGRGFADAHRRFAQAFLALPAVTGNVVEATPTDVRARVYPTASGTYIGVGYKGFSTQTLTVDVPGPWTAGTVVTDLVTGATVATTLVGGKLRLTVAGSPAMQLYAFHASTAASAFAVRVATPEAATDPGGSATYTITTSETIGTTGTIQLSATGAPAGTTVAFSPGTVVAGASATMTVTTTAATPAGTFWLTVTGSAGGQSDSAPPVALTVRPDLTVTDLQVVDTANSCDWQVRTGLREQIAVYSDRSYTWSQVPSGLVGAQWIRTALDSKSAVDDPLVTFTIDKPATICLGVDSRTGRLPWMDAGWIQVTGQAFTFHDNSDLLITLDLYQKAYPAGPVSLGPVAGGTDSAGYTVAIGQATANAAVFTDDGDTVTGASRSLPATSSVQTASPLSAGGGGYLHSAIPAGTAAASVTVAAYSPASAASSWRALCGAPLGVGGVNYLNLNGAFELFVRPDTVEPSSQVWFYPVDVSTISGATGLRLIVNGSSTGFQVRLLTGSAMALGSAPGTFTTNSTWHLPGAIGGVGGVMTVGAVTHFGITFSTDASTGQITLKVFRAAGTGAIDTASAVDLIATQTFYASADAIGTNTLPTGAWSTVAKPANGTTFATATDVDYDRVTIYSSVPAIFPAL